MTLQAAVEGLAATVRTAMAGTRMAGRVYAFGKDAVDAPALVVVPAPNDFVMYDRSFDGSEDYALVLKILVGGQDDRSGQAELLGYLAASGTNSIYAAVNADRTLGGSVTILQNFRGTAYGDVEWAGQVYFGAEILLECGT